MTTRRHLFLGAAGLGAWVAGFQVLPDMLNRSRGFTFTPLEQVPGFQTIEAGASSSPAFDFMIGLEPSRQISPRTTAAVKASPADALFFEGAGSEPAVPVAYFFDYYCPYCRVLSQDLTALTASAQITLSRHHWPLFGEASELAARAALAAALQGKGPAFHDRLMGTPVRVTQASLQYLAEDTGLSWFQMRQDMQSAAVAASLERTLALTRLFGLIGTPALVVGHTLVQGAISEARLRDLIAYERDEGYGGSVAQSGNAAVAD